MGRSTGSSGKVRGMARGRFSSSYIYTKEQCKSAVQNVVKSRERAVLRDKFQDALILPGYKRFHRYL